MKSFLLICFVIIGGYFWANFMIFFEELGYVLEEKNRHRNEIEPPTTLERIHNFWRAFFRRLLR